MSQQAPKAPYIYQPYGIQDGRERWNAGRIYAIGGLDLLVTIKGLTKAEADRVLAALTAEKASEPR
jgi:hypothetical protein